MLDYRMDIKLMSSRHHEIRLGGSQKSRKPCSGIPWSGLYAPLGECCINSFYPGNAGPWEGFPFPERRLTNEATTMPALRPGVFHRAERHGLPAMLPLRAQAAFRHSRRDQQAQKAEPAAAVWSPQDQGREIEKGPGAACPGPGPTSQHRCVGFAPVWDIPRSPGPRSGAFCAGR